ncbi:MAG: DUF2157 domain-containing protein [Alphaproteobacteria bacterium]
MVSETPNPSWSYRREGSLKKIAKKDLEWAASKGVIDDSQAAALWQALSDRTADHAKFDLIHVAYYFGALLVIGAMGWFLGTKWEVFGGAGIFAISVSYAAAFVVAGAVLWHRSGLRVPGGLLITMVVCMTPLAVYGLQRWLDLWGFDAPGQYRDFHHWIRSGWFAMEMATIAAGVVALWIFRFPFLAAPIAFVLWYVSVDLTPIIAGSADFDWELRRLVSLWFGLAMIAGSTVIDHRTEQDFAFWGYLFGLIAFWGGLSLIQSDSEVSKFLYFLINLALMWLSVFLRRRVFIVFGALGVLGYIGHLAQNIFEDSALFPFVLTAIGVAIIYLGILLKRHGAKIAQAVEDALPAWMKRLRPSERAGAG